MAARLLSTLAALALVLPGFAHAADLEASPRQVEAPAGVAVREVRLTNHSAAPMHLEVRAVAWDQKQDGQAILTPTRRLAVSPRSLTLAPGASGQVQLALRGPVEPFELAYQLVVREGPKGAATQRQLTVPVFVEPARAMSRAELSPPRFLGCTAWVELHNSGNAHLDVKWVSIVARDAQGRVVASFRHKVSAVLSGVTWTISEVVPHDACDETTLLSAEAETGNGTRQSEAYFTPQSLAVIAAR